MPLFAFAKRGKKLDDLSAEVPAPLKLQFPSTRKEIISEEKGDSLKDSRELISLKRPIGRHAAAEVCMCFARYEI